MSDIKIYEPELTPEQLEEFDTPILQIFLKSYLRFRHSSPYTSHRKLFRFFEPMKPEELSEQDNLYGINRKAAYKTLIDNFRACKAMHEFDKFFENKTYHWQSSSTPSLILLKSWLSANI